MSGTNRFSIATSSHFDPTCMPSSSLPSSTLFENHRKSCIQHCKRSELHLHFMWPKVGYKCQKWSILTSFWKPEACVKQCYRSILIGQKLVKIAKIEKFKCDIFQTLAFNICLIKIDLWLQASGFQKLVKMDHIWHF